MRDSFIRLTREKVKKQMTIHAGEMDLNTFNKYVKMTKKLKKLLLQRNEVNYKKRSMAKCLHITLNLCSLGIALVFIILPSLILYTFPEPCVIKVSPCLYRFTLHCILASGITLLIVFSYDIQQEPTVFLDIHILAAAVFFTGAVGVVIIATFHPQMIGQCLIWKYTKKQSFFIQTFIDFFQNKVECCGATSSNEWLLYGYLPASCCNKDVGKCSTTNIHSYPCIEAVLVKFGPYLFIISLCFLVLAACPAILIVITYKKLRSVRHIDVTVPMD